MSRSLTFYTIYRCCSYFGLFMCGHPKESQEDQSVNGALYVGDRRRRRQRDKVEATRSMTQVWIQAPLQRLIKHHLVEETGQITGGWGVSSEIYCSCILIYYCWHIFVSQRDANMQAVPHLTPELVMGQWQKPLQVLFDESGIFQKFLHLSRRIVFGQGLVRHKTTLLLPYWVLMLNRKQKVCLWAPQTAVKIYICVKRVETLTHQCRQCVLFSLQVRLSHLLLIQWYLCTGHSLFVINFLCQIMTSTQRNAECIYLRLISVNTKIFKLYLNCDY